VLVTHDTAIAKRCQRIFHVTDGRLLEGEGHALSL